MEIKSKIVHRRLSVKGNALSCTNRMYRFHTYVRMVQDLHYSYFPKQLLRKDKTYCCLKNRKPQAEVTWNSILKQSLAYKTAGSGREPKRRPSSQFHLRIMSHETALCTHFMETWLLIELWGDELEWSVSGIWGYTKWNIFFNNSECPEAEEKTMGVTLETLREG